MDEVDTLGGAAADGVDLEAAGDQSRHRVTADEAGPAGDEDAPHRAFQSG